MKIKIVIDTSNDTFKGQVRSEIAKILRKIADYLDYSVSLYEGTKFPLIDSNGNVVGSFMASRK